MVGAGRMTDPNVLGGDQFGLKFLFESGDTKLVQLCRPYNAGWTDALLSLSIMDSGLTGTQYVVPVGKVFYMLHFWIKQEGTSDINLSIQRNSTPDNSTLGDNLFQLYIEGTLTQNQMSFDVGGLQFDAGDYVTPYELTGAGSGQHWSFQCWGVECDA